MIYGHAGYTPDSNPFEDQRTYAARVAALKRENEMNAAQPALLPESAQQTMGDGEGPWPPDWRPEPEWRAPFEAAQGDRAATLTRAADDLTTWAFEHAADGELIAMRAVIRRLREMAGES